MAKCSEFGCNSTYNYVCICESSIERLCDNHMNIHMNSNFKHNMIRIDSIDYQSNLIQIKISLQKYIETFKSLKSLIQAQIKSFQIWISSAETSIGQIDEIVEYSRFYCENLQNLSNLPTYAKENLEALLQFPKSHIESLFSFVEYKLEYSPPAKFDLSQFSSFFDIITKISRPIINSISFQMQVDPMVFLCKDSKKLLTYFDSLYRGKEVTIMIRENNSLYLKQVKDHNFAAGNNPKFLKVLFYFFSKDKLMIITEKWTHTILNELHSRSFERAYIKEEVIIRIFRDLLSIFISEPDYKHITPNILHVTASGDYKIWYPTTLEFSSSETGYLSPEFEIRKIYGSNSEIDNMSAKSHNLYCIALVVLQIATLQDTSMLYREECKKDHEAIVMSLKEGPMRQALIGMLIRSLRLRLTFEKVLGMIGYSND